MGRNLADAFSILLEMMRARGCVKILTFTGNLMSTGLRGIFTDMARRRLFDIVITTCGSLDHDLARSFNDYELGSFDADDAALRERGYHRLGNIFLKSSSYGLTIENKIRDFLSSVDIGDHISTCEFSWMLGRYIGKESSFLYWCSRNRIPIVIPGIVDGAVGYQVWQFFQGRRFSFDLMRDETMISDLIWGSERIGALIIGGGISKHHALWWSQFARDGLDYAVYISTADEYDGSLSGARPREAVSWGKISPSARHSFVKSDATIVLPILYLALIQELEGR